jgi:hypothetical protein
VAQKCSIIDNGKYIFPANILTLQDKERETFIEDLLNAVPLFCLRHGKLVAQSFLVNYWSAITDNEVELEQAVRGEIVT